MSLPNPIFNFRAPEHFHTLVDIKSKPLGISPGSWVRRTVEEAIVAEAAVEALRRHSLVEVLCVLRMGPAYQADRGTAQLETGTNLVLRQGGTYGRYDSTLVR